VYPDVQAVLGIHGTTYPVVFADPVWAKYGFGRREKIKDPRTGKWARRNSFCNNVLRFLTRTLAKEAGVSYETMRAELIQGLLPEVTIVPAMVVALGLAQERGCAYVYAGG